MTLVSSSPPLNRKPYIGSRPSLVIAIDVGTTYSGVSFAILRPGEVPLIQGVTRFPDQGRVGVSKVPSVLYYDENGVVRAAGATTDDTNVMAQAEDENWTRVEYFKMHLRPSSMKLETNGLELSVIPKSKSPTQVLGDYLGYLYQCTVTFIQQTHVDGIQLWSSFEGNAEFVLSHPNGWQGRQQQLMREGAIYGKLIPDTPEGRARIKFVTEGEASLHACLSSGLGPQELHPGNSFIIADAGGGTLDVNTYEIIQTTPQLKIQELATPDCRFAGSIFVNRSAYALIQKKLKDSKYDQGETITSIVRDFDNSTKSLFSDQGKVQWVTIGGYGERNKALGIRNGKLQLEGKEVADCFKFSVEQAVESVKKQLEVAGRDKMDIWLVGGFAASPWLHDQLSKELASLGHHVYRPDTNTSKVVADGAVGYYLDRWVSARVARLTCGTKYNRIFDKDDPEHMKRRHLIRTRPSGTQVVPGRFHCFVQKGMRVSETTTFCSSFYREVTDPASANFTDSIVEYLGDLPTPVWIDTKPSDQFRVLCRVEANLAQLCTRSNMLTSPSGDRFWRVDFDMKVCFGLTEFAAFIEWTENGNVKCGPASLIFDD